MTRMGDCQTHDLPIAPPDGRTIPKQEPGAVTTSAGGNFMSHPQPAPGVVGPFAGLDVPWLLRMRAESRRNHPFLIWAPFEGPARKWSYAEFHERVGQLSSGLARRGVKPGEYVLIHLDNCIEAM